MEMNQAEVRATSIKTEQLEVLSSANARCLTILTRFETYNRNLFGVVPSPDAVSAEKESPPDTHISMMTVELDRLHQTLTQIQHELDRLETY